MSSYSCLSNQVFKNNDYKIVPIRYNDRKKIRKWRNEQQYHLRQSKMLSAKDQDVYFDNVISKLFKNKKPEQILFSYLENDILIGYGGLVHINWIDKKAEISFLIDTSLEKFYFKKHWTIFLKLIEHVAFLELKFHKIFTYAFYVRPHLFEVLEANNYIRSSRINKPNLSDKKHNEVIVHEKKNIILEINLRNANYRDSELLFSWVNDSITRKNSFDNSKVILNEHNQWLKKKINDSSSILKIAEINFNPYGLVRFDIKSHFSIIGISIDSIYRGRGFSYYTIIKGVREYFNSHNLPVLAYIKKSNIRSIRAFEKANFKFLKDEIVNGSPSFVYKLEKDECK